MNLFYLDQNPKKCAEYHCDKHVCKMIVETAQMLSTAHHTNKNVSFAIINKLYKPAYTHHPSTKWIGHTKGNYEYAYELFENLLEQYTYRYKKTHACERLLSPLRIKPRFIDIGGFYDPPQCMPDKYKTTRTSDDFTVIAYRNYYMGDKKRFAKWNHSISPFWFK
tara:strand:- start:154 stop:648 length:495 start_codon:yes stop_codon:yes gene_type:complete